MLRDPLKETYERTQAAQDRAYEHHEALLKCKKCKNRPYCHTVTLNCGAFTPKY